MIISGKELSDELRSEIVEKVKVIKNIYDVAPHLAVIIVGDDPASQSYVKGKSKACDEVGITNTTVHLPKDVSENELLRKIVEFNEMAWVDGILVQLPLPEHINQHIVMNTIRPDKDVDGFHPVNVDGLYSGKNCIKPCTPKGIIKLLESADVEIEEKMWLLLVEVIS